MGKNKLNIQSVCSYFHIACTLFLFGNILFYYSAFTQYGLILFFVSFVADYIASKRWNKGFCLNKTRIISLLLLLQFVLLLVYSLFETDTRYLSTFYEYRFSLLGFGIVGLLGVSDKFKVRHFAYASLLAVVAFVILLYKELPLDFWQLQSIKLKLIVVSRCRALNICSHMLLSVFLCVGMILFTKVIEISKYKAEKALAVFIILIFFLLVITSQGRVGMMNACIVLGCIFLRFASKKLRYLIPSIVVLFLAVTAGCAFLFTDNEFKNEMPALNKANPREFVWQDGVEIIKESPFIGVGASTNALRVKEKLLNDEQLCGMEKFLIDHLKQDHVFAMHTHNQIMQSWQEYGIIGLLAILGLFASIVWASRGSFSLMLIFLVIFIQLITDVIDGSVGNLGFSMYIYLMLVLICSKQMGKEQVSGSKGALSSPSNA